MNIEKSIKSHLPHDKLSSKIWKDRKMLPSFRESLLKISDAFIQYLGIPIDVTDIIMTGSYANYNYTVFSDIDLHIVVDVTSINGDTDLVEEFFSAKKKFWNDRRDIKLKGIEVELYPQDSANDTMVSSGVYSVQEDSWIIEPRKFKTGFDIENVKKAAKKVIKEIEIAIKNSIKKSSIEDLSKMLKKLKRMRQSGLERAGELSDENITYKVIRAQGYLQKLFETKYEIEDSELSRL